MVTLLYGYQGSGKSYHALSDYIIPALRKGQHVYTNISGIDPFLIAQIHSDKKVKIDPSFFHVIPNEETDENGVVTRPILAFWSLAIDKRALFVLDEIQNIYGSSNFRENQNSGYREGLKAYVALSRHRGDSVVFICQEPMMVDSVIRDLCEHWVHVRKLNFIFGSNTKKYICNHRKGGPKGELIKTQNCSYDPKVYVCYDSTDPGVTESETASDSVKFNLLKMFWWVPLVVIAFIAIFVFFHHTSQSLAKPKDSKNESSKENTPPPRIVSADGWLLDEDSSCITWLRGSSPVAKSCPDLGFRSGRIPCAAGVTASCYVDVLAGSLPRTSPGSDSDMVGSSGGRAAQRPATPSKSTLSPVGGG